MRSKLPTPSERPFAHMVLQAENSEGFIFLFVCCFAWRVNKSQRKQRVARFWQYFQNCLFLLR